MQVAIGGVGVDLTVLRRDNAARPRRDGPRGASYMPCTRRSA